MKKKYRYTILYLLITIILGLNNLLYACLFNHGGEDSLILGSVCNNIDESVDTKLILSAGNSIISRDSWLIIGFLNAANGDRNVIGASAVNWISGDDNIAVGSALNIVVDFGHSLIGSVGNVIAGDNIKVIGAAGNIVRGLKSTVILGTLNSAEGDHSTVVLGALNWAHGDSWVIGGIGNVLNCGHNEESLGLVLLGSFNILSGEAPYVAAGAFNYINGSDSGIIGGTANCITGNESRIIGGALNCITGNNSKVNGGFLNYIKGDNSKVSGFFNYIPDNDVNWQGVCYPFYLNPVINSVKSIFKNYKYRKFPNYKLYLKNKKKNRSFNSSDKISDYLELLHEIDKEAEQKSKHSLKIKNEVTSEIIKILNIIPEQLKEIPHLSNDHFNISLIEKLSQHFVCSKYKINCDLIEKNEYKDKIKIPPKINKCFCLEEITTEDKDFIQLKCGHNYHRECLLNSFNSTLDQDNLEILKCTECEEMFDAEDIVNITDNPLLIFKLQRQLLRKVGYLKLCPICSISLTQYNELMKWHNHCSKCDKDQCFNCGAQPHHDITCEDFAKLDDQGKLILVLKHFDPENFGKCPHCNILVEKMDGCDSMICGDNAPDKKVIGSSTTRGCGKKFSWKNRILITE